MSTPGTPLFYSQDHCEAKEIKLQTSPCMAPFETLCLTLYS